MSDEVIHDIVSPTFMKKIILLIIPLGIAVLIFVGFQLFVSQNTGKGALQVTATPVSSVYLDNVLIGKTPLCKCEPADLQNAGEHTIRIVPEDSSLSPFEEKITITSGVLTVVDRTFGEGATSHGSIITLLPLENKTGVEVLVLSFPEQADIFLDGSQKGKSPLSLTDVTASDHELRLTKNGYADKLVRIKTVAGYKLVTTVFLGLSTNSATPAAKFTEQIASESAQLDVPKITILETPTGFLRVRSEASLNSTEVGRVAPGFSFELLEEQTDWYKIKLDNGTEGWISTEYAQKTEEQELGEEE